MSSSYSFRTRRSIIRLIAVRPVQIGVVILDVLILFDEIDSSPLTSTFRFHDEYWVFVLLFVHDCKLLHLLPLVFNKDLKVSDVLRKHPSLRIKIKFFWKTPVHVVKKLSKLILATEQIHAWKVVDSLVVLELLKPVKVLLPSTVHPENVEVVVIRVSFLLDRELLYALYFNLIGDVSFGKHVSVAYEEVIFVFGNLSEHGVPCHRYVQD